MSDQILRELAIQLGITVEYAYKISVLHHQQQAIANLVAVAVVVGLSFAGYVLGDWFCRTLIGKDDGEAKALGFLSGLIGFMIIGTVAMLVASSAQEAILRMVNPEYYAIQDFLRAIPRK